MKRLRRENSCAHRVRRKTHSRPGQYRLVRTVVRWRGFPAVLPDGGCWGFRCACGPWLGALHASGRMQTLRQDQSRKLHDLGLWWPALIWVTFWFGRAWCIVCPLGMGVDPGGNLGARRLVSQRPLERELARQPGSAVVRFSNCWSPACRFTVSRTIPLFLVTSLAGVRCRFLPQEPGVLPRLLPGCSFAQLLREGGMPGPPRLP
jgi:hypothetical protein